MQSKREKPRKTKRDPYPAGINERMVGMSKAERAKKIKGVSWDEKYYVLFYEAGKMGMSQEQISKYLKLNPHKVEAWLHTNEKLLWSYERGLERHRSDLESRCRG